ncbi:reverse transcriptase [Gossypium australe]|uniref:Reverse transcriptase n=1 Tax=Gossypium australe TaxID=47621 RepID=A0A5B6X059_9ROSI|nr:reverse transcriptase [Gossypium australe]
MARVVSGYFKVMFTASQTTICEKTMCRMGFIDEWVSLVIGCVRTVNYFVLFNEVQEEEFKPPNGLR